MGMILAEEAYREWLVGEMDCQEGKSYKKLLRALYMIEFHSLIPYDDDRAKDGIALRDIWSDANNGMEIDFGPCKILEVLIGIAFRVEAQLFGSKWAEEWNYKKIFWVLIENLGLIEFCDVFFVTCDVFYEKIVTICDVFCDRKYTCDGFGNIFYIKNAQKDMRKLNIWTQMGIYVRNRWPI